MKYILNKLPVKTTNNFKINDLKVELDLPKKYDFNEYFITDNKDLIISKKIVNKKITSKIGLEFTKYLELNITIPKNKKIKEPIILSYDFKNDDTLINKINISYEENSSCDFIIIYKSLDNGNHFQYLVENTKSNKNSIGNISYINLMNDDSMNFISIENDVLEEGTITHNNIDLNSNIRVYNIYSNVYKNANNYINNIYLGKNNNIIDMNYYLNNIGENSKNIMRVEGTLDDSSSKIFRGTIDFLEGSTNAIGDESENCILLSDEAISRSLPQMLCHEESIVGTHGVSSGKIDEDKLFYIMSHGYSKKEAEKLIIMSKFKNIISNINNKDIEEQIEYMIENKLS